MPLYIGMTCWIGAGIRRILPLISFSQDTFPSVWWRGFAVLHSRTGAIAGTGVTVALIVCLIVWRFLFHFAVPTIFAQTTHQPRLAHALPVPNRTGRVARVGSMPRTTSGAPYIPGVPEVALTFDDGPAAYYTQAVLRLLRRFDIHATFFVVGRQVATFPDLVRAEAAGGNEVENHTWSHADLTRRSPYEASAEIGGTSDEVLELTGRAPRYLRPPYGSVNSVVRAEAAAEGEQIVLWNVDPRDWAQPGIRAIEYTILTTVHDRAIIICHDGGGRRDQTLTALAEVIPALKARGYRFVTVQQLMQSPPPIAMRILTSHHYAPPIPTPSVMPLSGANPDSPRR